MKKMMIIAVMMSAMLMPAEMMAKNNNRDFAKPRVENRMNNRKDFKVAAKRDNRSDKFAKARPVKPIDKKYRNDRPARRPKPVAKVRRPAPRPAPMPRPRPIVRPVYHNHCCANDAMETAATIVGIAALAALIAD